MVTSGFGCYQCQAGPDIKCDSSDTEHQLCSIDGR